MDNNDIQLVGGPCGQHGPYTFYKAFKYTKNGVKRIVTLSEFFFVKLWIDSDLLCIGELQLLWSDKNSDQVLASLRLYFLPENTPEGRMDHGEDEVLAISEKVVLRVEDLITWITVDAEWTWGRLAKCEREVKDPPPTEDNKKVIGSLTESSLDFSDVEKERKASDCTTDHEGPLVIILSYPRYCRYRAMMRRLEGVEDDYLKYKIVNALGGFAVCSINTRVLFCKDTFDYPELEGHELLCNHLAPKLKGRPRGKRKKRSISPGSESNESESSLSNVFNSSKDKIPEDGVPNGLRCDTTNLRRSTRSAENNNECKEFLKKLTSFMKANYTPIGRIPSLGYKELDLYSFYYKVQKLGGYDSVTANRLWKSVFEDMSGHHNSTSAATVVRRHYERFLLPYERHEKGEEDKPLPISERRRLKSKAGSTTSDPDTSEGTSRSGNSTPVPQTPVTPTTPTENKEFNIQVKSEGTTSSLRSVRVKPERQKDKFNFQITTNNISPEEDSYTTPVQTTNETNDSDNTDSESKKCDPKVIDIKPEPALVKVELFNVPDKTAEPLTSAVAPVAQKISPEKSPSPVEGKENIPLIKTGDTPSTNNKTPEIISVPYKPKSPEIIDLESETYRSSSNTKLHQPFLQEVKKRKLEILKEGGLEVTPVKAFVSAAITRDNRPSVIQPTGAGVHQPSTKLVKSDIREMPPPAISSVPPKRMQITVPQVLNVSPVQTPNQTNANKTCNNNVYSYHNGNLPPKVLQSKSIYSYSEKIIYGNPKDYVPFPNPVHTPRFVEPPRQAASDILDLTVTSPQKPTDIKFPNINSIQISPYSSGREIFKTPTTHSSLLEGRRLGSNLEITLVGPHSKSSSMPSNHLIRSNLPTSQSSTVMPPQNNKHGQKRSHTDNLSPHKIPRIDENGKLNKPLTTYSPMMGREKHKRDVDINIPRPYANRNFTEKIDIINSSLRRTPPMPPIPTPQTQKLFQNVPPVPIPYLSQLYDNSKPYVPILDPIYYSAAMQSLYSHSALSATPPVLPFPSTEQLKFYTDLMAHNSRLNMNFPFQVPPDVNPSIVNNNFKKP